MMQGPGFDMLDGGGESVELTPIIDVLFLLLTFFILAATFAAPSIDVTLAEAESAAAAESQIERITLSIDKDGMVHFEKNIIDLENIDAILEGKTPDTAVVFNVDAEAPFEAFISVMDRVKVNGYANFLINANPKSE